MPNPSESFNLVESSILTKLFAVYIDSTELKRMGDGRMIIKDFELIAFCRVLDINYDELKKILD